MTEFADSLAAWRRWREDETLEATLERMGVSLRSLEEVLSWVGATDATSTEAYALGFLGGLHLGRETMMEVAIELVATGPTDPTGSRGKVRPGLRRRR